MFKHVYVDLCDTLIKGNTTFMFLDSFFTHNYNRYYWFYRKISSSFIMRAIFKLLFTAKIDLNRRIAIRFLNGYSRSSLKIHVQWMLANNLFIKNKELADVIQLAKNKQIPVTIISASLDFIVEVIASHLSLNYFCSQLVYKNELCQGVIIDDLLFSKNKIFDEIEKDAVSYCFISDNIQDVEILKLCSHGYGVPTLKNEKVFIKNGIEFINYDKLINM
ncbi:haloacid dehalogenase-like hydrolase, partial [Salmonella enterica]|nr:haloacid dehalogenase-like hydrolase [Salmonella enterica]